jgi:hypothetical protein
MKSQCYEQHDRDYDFCVRWIIGMGGGDSDGACAQERKEGLTSLGDIDMINKAIKTKIITYVAV